MMSTSVDTRPDTDRPDTAGLWATLPDALDAAADLLGVPLADWQPLTGGETAATYRLRGHRLVARVACPGVNATLSERHLRWATALAQAGVPFSAPARPNPLECADTTVTVWHDLGDATPVDWHDLGSTVRALHDTGTRALAGDPDLHPVLDPTALTTRFEDAHDAGVLARTDADLLAGWVTRVTDLQPTVTPAHLPVLVHDDLWTKNVIQAGPVATLIDPDNFAWGPRDHDLAFITRDHALGLITRDQVTSFQTGYRGHIPTLDTAWAHAYVHRLRWVANLCDQAPANPAAQASLTTELPHWHLPRGPRDA